MTLPHPTNRALTLLAYEHCSPVLHGNPVLSPQVFVAHLRGVFKGIGTGARNLLLWVCRIFHLAHLLYADSVFCVVLAMPFQVPRPVRLIQAAFPLLYARTVQASPRLFVSLLAVLPTWELHCGTLSK